MTLRSLLFVPGDSERKQARACETAADALILDLEDSVAPAQVPIARERVRQFLKARPDRSAQQLWVRVNALGSGALLEDLVAVMPGAPDGIVLPKAAGAAEAVEVAHYLSALEAREGGAVGATRLLVIATETPAAVLSAASYGTVGPRLAALTWGAEDLSAALGTSGKLEQDGSLAFTFQLARSMCLLGAAAAGVPAIDTVRIDYRNPEALAAEAARARRDGFTGKLAIHPDQVEIINAAFTPTSAEIERAQRIVSAFDAAPAAGVLEVDGQMADRPHLLQARRILATAGRARRAP